MATSDELLEKLHQLHPSLIDLSLGRIHRALDALGRPQDRLPPTIHIAGTNGKGSTVAYLNAIFAAGGKRAHSFISPHLVRFHERIRLAGAAGKPAADISEAALVDLLERTEAGNGGQPITFFEITTAAAFVAFAEHAADYLILETGLGGRLDATNVIERPAVTVITPISLDHMDWLGHSVAEIAFEKAGIMKPGVPCILGPQQPEALAVLKARAAELDVPLKIAGVDFKAYEQQGRLLYEDADRLLSLPLPRLPGAHQVANAGSSIAAVLALSDWTPGQDVLETAMREVTWPARLQSLDIEAFKDRVRINPTSEIWLDGGHNQSAAEVLAHTMADFEEASPRPLHIVLGMMRRKDADAFIAVFEDLCELVLTVPVPGNKRELAWDADELAELAEERGMRAVACEGVIEALAESHAHARELGDEPVRILICGSLYLAGHVLALYGQHQRT